MGGIPRLLKWWHQHSPQCWWSSSTFFSWHIHSLYVISRLWDLVYFHQIPCSLVHFSEFFHCPFLEWCRLLIFYFLQIFYTILLLSLLLLSSFYSLWFFHTSFGWCSFPGVWREIMSPQVSRTLLNILADLENAVDWMVSLLPLISNSSNLFETLIDSTTIVITIHVFLFLWQGPSICLSFRFLLFLFRNSKIYEMNSSFFFLID